MHFLKSTLVSLIGTVYTLLGTPHAHIYTKIPFKNLESVCATNTPRTRLDQSLCENIKYGPGYGGGFLDIASQLYDSTSWWDWRRDKFSAPFEQAYFANGTTWKSTRIEGPWQSVEKSLKYLMNKAEIMPKIEAIEIHIYDNYMNDALWSMKTSGVPLPQPRDVSSGTHAILQALSRAENLKVLEIYIPADNAVEYDTVVKNSTIDPPIQATRVDFGAFTEGILRHMPKVNDVSIDWSFCETDEAQQRMMQGIMGTQLEHLGLCADDNLPSNIEVLMNGIPSLKRLTFRPSSKKVNVTAYTSSLKNFTRLIELNLPMVWDLDDDCNPWDGGSYRLDFEIMSAKRKESTRKLVETIREHLPFLRRVSFGGGEHHDLTRRDTSQDSVKVPRDRICVTNHFHGKEPEIYPC